jgi:hypothetical protein
MTQLVDRQTLNKMAATTLSSLVEVASRYNGTNEIHIIDKSRLCVALRGGTAISGMLHVDEFLINC